LLSFLLTNIIFKILIVTLLNYSYINYP